MSYFVDVDKGDFGVYAGVRFGSFLWWSYKNRQVRAKGRKARESRAARKYEFKSVDNADFILSLDVRGLREHLIKGTFTSVDLVNVFGSRTYKYGRELNLSTDELFD